MTRIFGTDGVRGLANELLTADMALDLSQAAAIVLGHDHAADGRRPRAVLARDGRASGEFLGAAVAAGLAASGVDVEDAGNSNYQLEVSSPGLDRPLANKAHFRRFIGERARVNMFAPVAGQRKFRGVILAVEGDTVDLGCDDQTYSLPIADMAKARLEPVFDD